MQAPVDGGATASDHDEAMGGETPQTAQAQSVNGPFPSIAAAAIGPRQDYRLTLTRQADAGAHAYAISEAEPMALGSAPAAHYRGPGPALSIVVIAHDAAGTELERQFVADPTLLWTDDFADGGQSARGGLEEAAVATLSLSLPSAAIEVRLHRAQLGTAGGYRLAELASARLPRGSTTMNAASADGWTRTGTMNVALVHGDDALENRIDLVFVAEGYDADEMERYATDVQKLVDAMFAEPVFGAYRDLFNVHRIDSISRDSGISDLATGVVRDTAFGYARDAEDKIDWPGPEANKARADTIKAHLPESQRDVYVVLFNDEQWIRSGASSAGVFQYRGEDDDMPTVREGDANEDRIPPDTFLHELGHVFGLADEYSATDGNDCPTSEPTAPNLTLDSDRDSIKWGHWVEASTPMPTSDEYVDSLVVDQGLSLFEAGILPGAFVGAGSCADAVWRPGFTTKMKWSQYPYGPVNEEAIVLGMFTRASPIDWASPALSEEVLIRNGDGPQTFAVQRAAPNVDLPRWYVDGIWRGWADTFTFSPANFEDGVHEVRVSVETDDDRVRLDANSRLTRSLSWAVSIDNCTAAPTVPTALNATQVAETSFTLDWQGSGGMFYDVQLGRLGAPGAWNTGPTTSETSTSLTDLVAASEQRVRVRARNACGDSAYSAPLTVPLAIVCGPPPAVGLTTSEVGSTSFVLAWEPSLTANRYVVELSSTGSDWQQAATTTATQATLEGLPAGSLQFARVLAINDCGESAVGDMVAVALRSCATPQQPANLVATNVTDSGFRLDWSAAPGATAYDLQLYDLGTGDWQDHATVTGTQAVFSSLPGGTTQYVRLIARSACAESSPALIAVALPSSSECTQPPAPPANTTATTQADGSVLVSWSAVPGAERYVVQVWDLATNGFVVLATTDQLSTSLTTLSSGSDHYVAVRAENACGASENGLFAVAHL